MLKPPQDDSAIPDPARPWSWGTRLVSDIELKARATYPDHLESRNQYVREKVAEKLTELWVELQEIKGRIAGLEK